MTDTSEPEQVDPQEAYLQEQAAAVERALAPDTRRRRAPSVLPSLSEHEALDRIAALLHGLVGVRDEVGGLTTFEEHVAAIIAQTDRQAAEVAARLAQPSRLDRFETLAGDYDIDLESVRAQADAYQRSALPRFALVEHSADGSPWFTLHDTPEQAAEYHHGQENAGLWTIVELVDLDDGSKLTAETKTAVTWSPV